MRSDVSEWAGKLSAIFFSSKPEVEKFAFSLMEIDVSLLFISCFSEYPVFSRITIQLKVLLSQQICGIIAAKQLLYPSYGQDDAQAEPAPVPMANYTISLRDYGNSCKTVIMP